MVLKNHRWLPVSILECQNLRFMVFEAVYCKGFSKLVISKEQAKI
jgi:hypothetical protein